eukprot:SM000256S08684  [mRNA]  locus=s256:47223:48161:+ [translate_table: standard]
MLGRVGAFSKDPTPATCVTVCGVSELDACTEACRRSVCASWHHLERHLHAPLHRRVPPLSSQKRVPAPSWGFSDEAGAWGEPGTAASEASRWGPSSNVAQTSECATAPLALEGRRPVEERLGGHFEACPGLPLRHWGPADLQRVSAEPWLALRRHGPFESAAQLVCLKLAPLWLLVCIFAHCNMARTREVLLASLHRLLRSRRCTGVNPCTTLYHTSVGHYSVPLCVHLCVACYSLSDVKCGTLLGSTNEAMLHPS